MNALWKNKAKLLTLEQARERLQATEPMTALPIDDAHRPTFELDPDWHIGLDSLQSDEVVSATIELDGTHFDLTKEAALQAGAAFGLPAAYVRKAPPKLVEPQLNYWFNDGLDKTAFNLMVMAGTGVAHAFAKPSVQPFSNLDLLDHVITAVREWYEGEILVDFKFDHALTETNIRLVFSGLVRAIDGSDVDEDVWSPGVAIKNSLIGKKQTSIEGYLFRWENMAGAIVPLNSAGAWSRKSQGQLSDLVFEWARESVEQIWPNFDDAFDAVQKLTNQDISHNLGEIVRDVFDLHKVPVTQRNAVLEEITPIEVVTMYHLQQAIARTANSSQLSPQRTDTLLKISGAISVGVFDPVKAKIWREGNKAPKGAKSPYEIEEKN